MIRKMAWRRLMMHMVMRFCMLCWLHWFIFCRFDLQMLNSRKVHKIRSQNRWKNGRSLKAGERSLNFWKLKRLKWQHRELGFRWRNYGVSFMDTSSIKIKNPCMFGREVEFRLHLSVWFLSAVLYTSRLTTIWVNCCSCSTTLSGYLYSNCSSLKVSIVILYIIFG